MSLAYWICVVITFASAITSCVFSIIALHNSKDEALVNALYASSRSVALVVASAIPLFYHSIAWLSAIALIMILVQVLDALVGAKTRDALKTYGPAATALFNLLALVWVLS